MGMYCNWGVKKRERIKNGYLWEQKKVMLLITDWTKKNCWSIIDIEDVNNDINIIKI